MTRNNHVVRPLTAFGAALLLCVLLLPLAGAVTRPVRATLIVRKLTYVVEPVLRGDSYRFSVSLSFQGDSSGKSRLLLPLEWSHGVDLYRAIRNLQPSSEDIKIEDTKEPHVKVVHHQPNQRVSLTYEIVSQPPGAQLTLALYHYPVLRPTYFYVIGQALWVYPDMPETTPLRVTLHWKNIPDGWALINSFGAGEPRQTVDATLEQFRAGTFLAGDYRVKRFVVDGRPVYTVTRGWWGFPDEEFHGLVERIIRVARDFWQSYDFPYNVVALLPTDDPSAAVVGGERRTNSFSLYLPKSLTTLSGHQRLLAHELFHAWNPGRLGRYENDRLYWFGEGFTDYYAPLLLLRAGLISLDEYMAGYNSLVKDYYASPMRSLTVEEMVKNRRTSSEAEKLFYRRGYLLAHHWDVAIRSGTNGKRSLDDVMRGLLKSAKASGFKLTEKRIADALRPYLQGRGASDIEKYMDRGELVPADNPLGGCAIAEAIEYHPFDAGFDFEKWVVSRVISGVVPDSNAHRAGLRDGQKWVTGGFVRGDSTRLTKLTVIEGDTQKVVQYYPAAREAIRLPQYKLKPGISDEERARCLSQLGLPSAPQKSKRKGKGS